MKAIDISVYQGHPGAGWWRMLKQDGWDLAIVGSWHGTRANSFAQSNLNEAKSAGLHTATYVALNASSGRQAVRNAKQACGTAWDDLSFVAIDCETDGITAAVINEALAEVGAEHHRPIMYTAAWWWDGHFGNPDTFKQLPLWNADYDQQDVLDLDRPFGGWTAAQLKGKQYDGSTQSRNPTLHGVTVDMNIFDRSWVVQGSGAGRPTPTPPSDDATKRELANLHAEIRALREEVHAADEGIHQFMATALTSLDERVKALEN